MGGPIAVPDDRIYQIEVPFGSPNSDMLGIATAKAKDLRYEGMPLVGFAVPLNSYPATRHQVHLKRPSLGFSGVCLHGYEALKGVRKRCMALQGAGAAVEASMSVEVWQRLCR